MKLNVYKTKIKEAKNGKVYLPAGEYTLIVKQGAEVQEKTLVIK